LEKVANTANGNCRSGGSENTGKHRLYKHGIAQTIIGKKSKNLNALFVERIPYRTKIESSEYALRGTHTIFLTCSLLCLKKQTDICHYWIHIDEGDLQQ
jgi:hypothetical protein